MNRTWLWVVNIAGVLALGTVASAQTAAQSAVSAATRPSSAVPRSVPFNGQVLSSKGEARTGTVLVTFGLYPDQEGGTPVWTEQQVVTLDAAGHYAAILGSTSVEGLPAEAFAAGTPKWLGVQVDGEAEQPRFMLLSVPYALKAGDADTVGGKPVSDFVLSTNLFDSVKSTLGEHGYAPGSSSPTTSGTAGKIGKFVDASNLGDSIMVEDTGRIGINNPTIAWLPYQTFRLDNNAVQGSGFTVASTIPGGHYYTVVSTGPSASTGAGYLTVYDEGFGQFRMVIDPTGKVGFGTMKPIAPLEVAALGQAGGDIEVAAYGSLGAGILGRKARGTSSAPTAVLTSDILGAFGGRGYGTTGFGDFTGGMVAFATQDWTDAAQGTGLGLFTTLANTNTPTEAVRIAGGGFVGIGTTVPVSKLTVSASGAGLTHTDGTVILQTQMLGTSGSIGTMTPHDFVLTAASLPAVTISAIGLHVTPAIDGLQTLGSLTNRWAAVFAANGVIQTSDARLKKSVTNLGYGLEQLMKLRPVTYQWNDRADGRTHLGLIAQEVEQIIPEVVERASDSTSPLGINYSSLVPVLIKAIQEQQADNAALAARNAELDARLAVIEQALQLETVETRASQADQEHR